MKFPFNFSMPVGLPKLPSLSSIRNIWGKQANGKTDFPDASIGDAGAPGSIIDTRPLRGGQQAASRFVDERQTGPAVRPD